MSGHFWVCCVFVECSGNEKPPIDIEVTFSKYGHGLYWIDIISNVDSITILSAKINRGDCDNNGFPYFKINKTLRFGDSYQFYLLPFRCQHIKEVSIKTDKGTWNFTFARK
ncbi:hypothetical protein [Helicobacter pylori]|uniref:hypothetical protein n=1 Tax=Helicobacter pylori TaxID=210 RepID=UPI000BE9FE8B|nr:hypothetical protein [Helicobacter pylori]PDX27080.1 hypothetical protein BB458_03450 [Helicobacter pylori]